MGKEAHRGKKGVSKKGHKTGTGFTDIRKKKAINSYKKILRKEKRDDDLHKVIKRQKAQKHGYKPDSYAAVKAEIEQKKAKAEQERLQKQQEKELKTRQREEAQAAAAERRKQRQKLFSKKTRKGQPYLHNQMTLLLNKIEKNIQKEKRNKT